MTKSASEIAAEWAATDALVAIGIPSIMDLSDDDKDRVVRAYLGPLSDDEELTLRTEAIADIPRLAIQQAYGDHAETGRLFSNALYQQLEGRLAALEDRAALQIDAIERATYGDRMYQLRAVG